MPGDRVAYATTFLGCGTGEELNRDPDVRLHLTVGQRKEQMRWTIAHEHHPFAVKESH